MSMLMDHCGRVGYGVDAMIRSWVRIPAKSVIVGTLGKSESTYTIPQPLHTKEVNNGTSEATDGTID